MQKTSKALLKYADKKSGNFSDARASFFVGLSMKIGVDTGKNNGIERGWNPCGSFSQPLPFAGQGLYRTAYP